MDNLTDPFWACGAGSAAVRRIAHKVCFFYLISKSEINKNSLDTKDHPKGVWTLPPTFRLKEVNKEKYMKIGESDRMTLKFIKN